MRSLRLARLVFLSGFKQPNSIILQPGPIERDQASIRTWNAQTLMELADCDVGVVPPTSASAVSNHLFQIGGCS